MEFGAFDRRSRCRSFINMLAIPPMDRWAERLEGSSMVDEESERGGWRGSFACPVLKEEELKLRVWARRRMAMAGS
jgi:hypothetical protein